MTIDAKAAVQIAKKSAVDMLNQNASNLEEIETDSYKDREVWSITLSFPRDADRVSGLVRLTTDPLQYKRFLIDGQTGELVAIKMRDIPL